MGGASVSVRVGMEIVSSSTDLVSSDGELYAIAHRVPCFAILFTPGEDAARVIDSCSGNPDATLVTAIPCEPIGLDLGCVYVYNLRSLDLIRRQIPSSTTCFVMKLAAGHEGNSDGKLPGD